MGRVTGSRSSSYGHKIRREGGGWYTLYWAVDFKYAGSRLRYPRGFHRSTDEQGALRFAKKWGVPMPEAPDA
jgi:hypothetical protein